MDFGRITFPSGVVLYLFGTPGQERFWFMWDELAFGAIGAVVLADTRRLADCFSSIDYFERRNTPFIVAANHFEGSPVYDHESIREALDLEPDVPVLICDARQPRVGEGSADHLRDARADPASARPSLGR